MFGFNSPENNPPGEKIKHQRNVDHACKTDRTDTRPSIQYQHSDINISSEIKMNCIVQHDVLELPGQISSDITSLFRGPGIFEIFSEIAANWAAENQKSVKIWCPDCCTGETAYYLAMILDKALNQSSKAKILATDCSVHSLRKVKRGVYDQNITKMISTGVLARYCRIQIRNGELFYTPVKRIKQMLRLAFLDISDPPFPIRSSLDAIFCPGSLSHFQRGLQNQIIDSMYTLLKPGGYLLLGQNETLNTLDHSFSNIIPSLYMK